MTALSTPDPIVNELINQQTSVVNLRWVKLLFIYHILNSVMRLGFLVFFHSPIKVSQTRRIAKSFCKRIRIDFQFCNQLILIGRHGREYSLREYEGFMIHILQFLGIAGYALPMAETH